MISSLFQLTLLMLLYAVIEGYEFSSYYIFWGSLLFALVYVSLLRWVFDRVSGFALRKAGYKRRAVIENRIDVCEARWYVLQERIAELDAP